MKVRARPGEDHLATFLRGLVVGAFVGAAIAGSAAWRRIRRSGHPRRSPGGNS